MKNQINLLNQLQELVLTRDEHHATGDGSRMDALDKAIDDLVSSLQPEIRSLYTRLYKKDHIVMSPMNNGCCAICGMTLPISQVQAVKLCRQIQNCPSCARMLFLEEDGVPRWIGEKSSRTGPRKSGVSRFSAEELMIPDLKSSDTEGAIRELAEAMERNKFVSRADALVAGALKRESMLSTALGDGLAFPHVRGVEGGGLTLALGVSKKGFVYDDGGEKVNIIFFSAIPAAVSPFYLRLMKCLTESFSKEENRKALLSAQTQAELWKALTKATRYTIK